MHTTNSEQSSKDKPSVLKSFFTRSTSTASVERIPQSGDLLQLDGFGGSFELTDGHEATLKNLLDISIGGVILFTYPKANTPGCTAQACLFRDIYQHLRSLGFAVYGLSKDSPKSNDYFRSKNNLPFSLICDTRGCLINALGFTKRPFGILRGVVVIDKEGRILTSVAGSPDATVKAVYGVCGDGELFPPSVGAQSITDTVNIMRSKGQIDVLDKQEAIETLADVVGKVNITASRLDNGVGNV